MLRHRDSPTAWDVLAAELQPGRMPEERLAALNHLSAFPAFPNSIITAMRDIPPAVDQVFTNYNRRAADFLLARSPEVPD